tara:strand:- start:127 stop:621 length:495 start_codon:yes stop_codon:yes gene_type:complete
MQDKVYFEYKEDKYCVSYEYTKAGSCCGAEVLSDIWIGYWVGDDDGGRYRMLSRSSNNFSKEVKLGAFKALNDYINNGDFKRSWSAGLLLMIDYVKMRGNNRQGYFTREFCEWADWNTDGIAVKNPNSAYHVQLWTKYVTKQKVNPHYAVCEVNDVTNESLSNA